jgi:anti-sigma B factor antagonist
MSLKMGTREVNGIVIIDLSGQITLGEASAAIRDEVRDQLANEFSKLLLNLADVTYIDSAGLGELTAAYTSVRNRGGELKLLNLTKRVHDLMQITKLYTVFDVHDNEKKAIASFGA